MKKSRFLLTIFASVLICGGIALVNSTGSVQAATNPSVSTTEQPNVTTANISHETKTVDGVTTDHDLKKLGVLGITLDDHVGPSKLDKKAVVDAATQAFPNWAADATSVKVEHHLMTNPNFNGFSPQALEKNPDLKSKGFMDKQPVYIVSFRGMSYTGHTPAHYKGQVPIHHEYNVVVDATTDEPLMGFSYR